MSSSTSLVLRRRAVLSLATASLLFAAQLDAQTGDRVMEGHRTPRRYVYPVVGAAVGGLASLVYFWSGPNSLPGTCAGSTCVALASLGSGAFIGWLVGKEKDDLHALRYRGGRPLRPDATSVDLTGEPMFLTSVDTLVAASGPGGVQIVRGGSSKPAPLAIRAAGLRGITDAVLLPDRSEVGLTAAGGFYRFPMTGEQKGLALRAAPAQAVAALGNDFIVAAGTRVERIRRDATDMGASWPGLVLPDTVRAIKTDARGIIWAVTSTELIALRTAGDSLVMLSRTPMPRGAVKLDVSGPLAAVALGDSGVRFVSVTDPEAPRVISDWKGVRFAYDVALGKGKAYVASGIDGVALVSLKNDVSPILEGLMRELGFIVAVSASDPYVYALDRGGTAILKRIRMDF